MLKKVLLLVLFLTAISGETEAKGRFKLSDGQKKVLKIGGGAAAGLFSVYCVFALYLANLKCSHVYDHIIYWHCDKSSHKKDECKKDCEKYDFKKNQFLNLPEDGLAKLKAGNLPLLHDEKRHNIIFIKTESGKSYEPIEIIQFCNDFTAPAIMIKGTAKNGKVCDGNLDKQISKSEKYSMTFARFGDAFLSPREVAYHGKKLVVGLLKK